MKPIIWLGQTLKEIRTYPEDVRKEIGYNLDRVQRGLEPCDCKSLIGVGQGVKEIRIHDANEYRVVYVVKFKEAIYILHCFIKKTQKTAEKDLELIRKRYAEMLENRRGELQ